MSLERNYHRFKKKAVMAMLISPENTQKKLLAFNGYHPRELLRKSEYRAQQEINGLSKNFPEIGRRLIQLPKDERATYLSVADRIGPRAMEFGLSKGVALEDMRWLNRETLKMYMKFATPENVRFIRGLGFNKEASRVMTTLLKVMPKEKLAPAIEDLKKINPEFVSRVGVWNLSDVLWFYRHEPEIARAYLRAINENTQFNFIDLSRSRNRTKAFIDLSMLKMMEKKYGLEKTLEMIRGKKMYVGRNAEKPVRVRRKHVDFRRYGKSLFDFKINPSENQEPTKSLLEKGVRLFQFTGQTRKIATMGPRVTTRQVLTLSVPEHSELLRSKKAARRADGRVPTRYEHLKGSLCFADIHITHDGKKNDGIFIQELQSDIVNRNLSPELREKYGSWEKVLVLSVAKYAKSLGLNRIEMSSPHLIKGLWNKLTNEELTRVYYDVPNQMGFLLGWFRGEKSIADSGFGVPREASSNVCWWASVKELEKKYPEFFRLP